MADWSRMVWQYKANQHAVRVRIICIILYAPEVFEAFKYHFPWWDDALLFGTTVATLIAVFVQRYTQQYRDAIDGYDAGDKLRNQLFISVLTFAFICIAAMLAASRNAGF